MGAGAPVPAVLHLRTVRYLSHAGADLETAYRTGPEIRADHARDPLLATGRWLVSAGGRSGEELAEEYLAIRARVRQRALAATERPQLRSAQDVVRPLAPRSPAAVAALVGVGGSPAAGERMTLAQAVNAGLAAVLERHPEVLVFGEDVGVKGGVYGVTRGLQARFGPERVFDTLLDETSILGLALGTAVTGFVPIPEIQYLAYLHNAEDQLRGEAATLQFFSQGAYRNGMVVRIQGYGYQKGFGGHFHNDNGLGVLRDIPGLVIASPVAPRRRRRRCSRRAWPRRRRTAASASISSRSRCTTPATSWRRATTCGPPSPVAITFRSVRRGRTSTDETSRS